jgi:hypothetical protein
VSFGELIGKVLYETAPKYKKISDMFENQALDYMFFYDFVAKKDSLRILHKSVEDKDKNPQPSQPIIFEKQFDKGKNNADLKKLVADDNFFYISYIVFPKDYNQNQDFYENQPSNNRYGIDFVQF